MNTQLSKQGWVYFVYCCFYNRVDNVEDLKTSIFSDECTFSLFGGVNKQNCRVRETKRLQKINEVPKGTEFDDGLMGHF